MKDFEKLYNDTFEQLKEQVIEIKEHKAVIEILTRRIKDAEKATTREKSKVKKLEKKLDETMGAESIIDIEHHKILKKNKDLEKKLDNAGRKMHYMKEIIEDYIYG